LEENKMAKTWKDELKPSEKEASYIQEIRNIALFDENRRLVELSLNQAHFQKVFTPIEKFAWFDEHMQRMIKLCEELGGIIAMRMVKYPENPYKAHSAMLARVARQKYAAFVAQYQHQVWSAEYLKSLENLSNSFQMLEYFFLKFRPEQGIKIWQDFLQ
jgi:hypothetical protein